MNAVREYSVHSTCLAMFSVTFVCVCLKNAHLHTYRSSIYAKRVHASSFTALYMPVYMSPDNDVFARSIESTEIAIRAPSLYSTVGSSDIPGALSKH